MTSSAVAAPRVLVVDDSKVSRIMSIGHLKKLRPELVIVEANNVDEALLALNAQAFDWMILDHNMPGRTGLDLAESLQSSHPNMRIALLTANVQDATQNRAEAIGTHFFKKPISEAVVKNLLRTLEDTVE
jgi:two-component system, chemotaxis family, chemotaxis protein CheY